MHESFCLNHTSKSGVKLEPNAETGERLVLGFWTWFEALCRMI